MKKQIISIFLALCMLFSGSAYAFDSNTLSQSMIEVAKDYLLRCTENMYLYTDNEILESTLFSLSDSERLSAIKIVSSYIVDKGTGGLETKSDQRDYINSFPDYISEKVEYFRTFRRGRDIIRKEFNVEYDVLSYKIDGELATVRLYETICFYYDDVEEETVIGTVYDVVLYKSKTGWLICDVIAYDYFDREYRKSGLDLEKMAYEAETFTKAIRLQDSDTKEKISIEMRPDMNERIDSSSVSVITRDPTYVEYDAFNAMCYAMTYTVSKSYTGPSFYNSNFDNYITQGGDCQNFASQCIWAGFGGSDDLASVNGLLEPMDCDWPAVWYDSNAVEGTSSWKGVTTFADYIIQSKSESGNGARIEAEVIGNYGTNVDVSQLSVGDEIIIQYDDEGVIRKHAVFIVAVNGDDWDDVLYCAHTADVKCGKLTDFGSVPTGMIIKPQKFYYSRQTTDGGAHSYSSVEPIYGVDTTCNHPDCNHHRLRLSTIGCDPIPVGTSLPIFAYSSCFVYRMAIGITSPSGVTTWTQDTHCHTFGADYTFTEPGLYTVSLRARDLSDTEYPNESFAVNLDFKIRVY